MLKTWPQLRYLMVALQQTTKHLIDNLRKGEGLEHMRELVSKLVCPVMLMLQRRVESTTGNDDDQRKRIEVCLSAVRNEWCSILEHPVASGEATQVGTDLLQMVLENDGGAADKNVHSRNADHLDQTHNHRLAAEYKRVMTKLQEYEVGSTKTKQVESQAD